MSVLRYTDSDYPFGIFKLFFWKLIKQNNRCTIFQQDKLLWLTVISNNTEKTMTTAPIFCCFRPQKIELIFLDIDLFLISSVSKQHTHYPVSFYLRDRPFNLKGGLWFFVSFRIFFSDNTRVRIFIFIVAQSSNFFSRFQHYVIWQKLWIRLFFFSSTKIRIFFLEKNHNPPFKLNGRSLIVQAFQIYNYLLTEIIIKRIIRHQRREHW